MSDLIAVSVDITQFGAKADGENLNTRAIQEAIDYCTNSGGGEVIIPQGTFITGTLVLRSNVILFLEQGAVLQGSSDKNEYPIQNDFSALIYSANSKNVSIRGYGIIDGNGKAFYQKDNAVGRPILIVFDKCKDVRVQDVFLKNSAMWTLRLYKCDGVMVNRIDIYSHDNYNNDGIDIESRNVIISDCRIDTDDDAICFKSEEGDCMVENVTITNCILSSNCNFIKFGTGSHGVFRNVAISNCVLHKASESKFRSWEKIVWGVESVTGISGIALEVVDGGIMDQIAISNITMMDVQTPVFIRLGKRNKDDRVSVLKNILLSNIIATSESFVSSSITGIPEGYIENVTVRDCIFNIKGGGQVSDTQKEVPLVADGYPENRMFGQMLPAYGFFIRYAKNVIFDNIQLRYHTAEEERHAIVAADVFSLRIRNSQWQKPVGNLNSLQISNCSDFLQQDNRELDK